jgi:hypothetical protein
MMKGRNMKLKQVLVVASLIAAASTANAAIDTDTAASLGAGDGGGELFVSVFRNVAGQEQSYLIDSGITALSLLTGTVADGTILGNVGGFFGTAPTASFRFNAGAVANVAAPGQLGSIFTTNNEGAAQNLANLTDFPGISAINGTMETFVLAANATLPAPTNFANNDDLSGLVSGNGGYHNRFEWGSALGGAVSFSTEGTLDSALALWGVVANADFSGFTRVALGFLTAESGTGNIVYSSSISTPQVPLPAAVWLLGSALVGMSAIRRRRIGATTAVAA